MSMGLIKSLSKSENIIIYKIKVRKDTKKIIEKSKTTVRMTAVTKTIKSIIFLSRFFGFLIIFLVLPLLELCS